MSDFVKEGKGQQLYHRMVLMRTMYANAVHVIKNVQFSFAAAAAAAAAALRF